MMRVKADDGKFPVVVLGETDGAQDIVDGDAHVENVPAAGFLDQLAGVAAGNDDVVIFHGEGADEGRGLVGVPLVGGKLDALPSGRGSSKSLARPM
mgnify:CR=1 FL=1